MGAAVVVLGNAWSWVLTPDEQRQREGRLGHSVVAGWYIPNREIPASGKTSGYTVKRFRFVDMADSVAHRLKFGDSVGLITAAFYAERGRAIGVGEGPSEQRNLRTVDFHPGRLLAVAQIRYVDERELEDWLSGQ